MPTTYGKTAADLPTGSVVMVQEATQRVVYIKNHPVHGAQWRGTDGSYVSNAFLDNRSGFMALYVPAEAHDHDWYVDLAVDNSLHSCAVCPDSHSYRSNTSLGPCSYPGCGIRC